MNNEIKLEFGLDYFQILEQDDDCMIVSLDLLHLGENRNECDISKECVEKSLPTIFNKPIIYRLNNKYHPAFSNDVTEHARNSDEEKSVCIAGTIPESSTVEYVERDNKTYLRMFGVIHKHYQPILVQILKNRNGEVKVSIEIKAKGEKNSKGIFVIEKFKFLSVCLLSKDIMEGIEGSEMVVTKFSYEDYNNHYLNFANKQFQEDKYKIPQNVKANAEKGLKLRKEYGRGGTAVGMNMAKYIIKNEYASYEKAKKISQYFPRHAKDNLDEKDPPSNGYIAWLLWGSDEGWKWSKGIVDKKEKEEGDQVDNSLEMSSENEELNSIDMATENNEEIKNNKEEGEKVEENKVEFSLTSDQIYNIFGNAIGSITYMCGDYESRKYWVETYDEEYVYLHDCEEGKVFRYPYMIADNIATIDFENKIEVIRGGYMAVGGASEEEIKNAEDENKEENEKEPEDFKAKFSEMESKFTEMETKYNALNEEFTMAKNKLMSYEKAEEEAKMSAYVQEFAHCMSEEEMNSFTEMIGKSTYAELKNAVDTKAIEYAKTMKEAEKEEKEIKNSFKTSSSMFGLNDHYFYESSNKPNDLDSIIKNSGVKIGNK